MVLKEVAPVPEIGEPYFLRNLTIFPLYADEKTDSDFITLDEGLSSGKVKVEELDRANVNSVRVINSADELLFILEGEEIYGALQNRVFNTTVILDPMTEHVVPVSCVEEGRWSGSEKFEGSTGFSHPTLRAVLSSTVTTSLKKNRRHVADQSRVWSTVKTTLQTLKVSSATLSLSDSYRELRRVLDSFVEEAEILKNATGFLACAGSKIIGMDVFYSKDIYHKEFEKLIRSYALEALFRMKDQKGQIKESQLNRFMKNVFETETSRFPAVGKGEEFRVSSRSLTAKLTLIDSPVHLSAFQVVH